MRSAKADGLPRINSNKLYRAPPTPPLEKLHDLERAFKLDGIAVSNISQDYSRANPKLGSVIPPYNSIEDRSVSSYFSNFGVNELLKKTGQLSHPESIPGRVQDRFYSEGAGQRYLERRNLAGNGHHPETVDGHSRYQGESLRVMIGYNNMYGYRRNIPKLRCEPPSTFSFDPRWYDRIKNTYGAHYTEEELLEHFKHTYVIGYPFWDNNYNNFHPMVKYIISVKTGKQSPDEYNGNLGINIVARNFDTGFIKLDKNIAVMTAKEKAEGVERQYFKRGQLDVFQFEDQDIRTISAIILSRDVKGDEVLYLDYVDVEIHKPNEKQSYRFPFDGWVRKAKQDKKTEALKARFGKKNSIISYPNEKPKYEYTIIVSPQMSKNTEYTIDINYDIRDYDEQCDYRFEFASKLPKNGKLAMRLTGSNGESSSFNFDSSTETADDEYTFDITSRDIGDIKYASLVYDDKNGNDYDLKNFKIIDPDGLNYLFEIDQPLRAKKEKIVKGKVVSQSPMEPSNDPPSDEGKLFIKFHGQTEETSMFLLKNALESKDGIHTFKKNEAYIGMLQSVRFRFESKKNLYCRVKSIKITSNKGHEFKYTKSITLRNFEETVVHDRSKSKKSAAPEPKKNGQIMVQIIGEKLKTDLFPLKDASSNDDDLDEYYKTNHDLGKIKNVYVKFEDKPENNNSVDMKYIEVIDPRGNSYKFVMDLTMKSGQDIMLPRKNTTKQAKPETESEEKTTEEETVTEETEPPTETEDESKRKIPESPKRPDIIDYDIIIKKGAGAASVPISLTIHSENDKTENFHLVPEEKNSFIDINKQDTFKMKDKDIGKIQKITLNYEATGLKSAWHLDEIEIKTRNETLKFPVDRAFINKESIELKPGEKPPGTDIKGTGTKVANKFKGGLGGFGGDDE